MDLRLVRTIPVILATLAFGLWNLAGSAHAAPAERITGGTKVDRGEYDSRWQAMVSLGQATEGEAVLGDDRPGWLDRHQCGGTLVREDVVVTAAHCVDGAMWRRYVHGRLRILAGSRRLYESGARQRGQAINVLDVRIHPSWSGASSFFDESPPEGFDVAVLRLARPVTGLRPMRLIGAGEPSLWGNGAGLPSGAFLAGWGVTNALYSRVDIDEADEAQAELREVRVPLLSDSTCERTDLAMGRDAEDFDRTTMLCAWGRDTDPRPHRSNRRGACFGDSGGPAAVIGADGAPRLVGIVSWGPSGNGGCQLPSVLTRVDAARPWIDATIAELDTPSPLEAAAPTSATVSGSDTVHLRWPAATGSPVRYTVLREVPVWRPAELDERADEDDEPLTPAVRRWLLAQRILLPVASTGPESREAFVRDVPPARPGRRLVHRFRIEVRDAAGSASRSAPLAVDAPVDGRAPGRPVVRAVAADALRRIAEEDDLPPASIGWRAVGDNDCVSRYTVHVALAGTRRWRHVEDHDAEDCPSSFEVFSPFHRDEGDSTGTRYVTAIPNVAGGVHVVRVAAVDRAGNVTWSVPRRVRVRPTADSASCTVDDDGSSGCGWSSGSD